LKRELAHYRASKRREVGGISRADPAPRAGTGGFPSSGDPRAACRDRRCGELRRFRRCFR
jgi:hypothetical protein